MICHSSIVLPHSQKPAAQHLQEDLSVIQVIYFNKKSLDNTGPHLIVNFKLLNYAKFQEHPKWRSDHGVIVQGEVVEVKLIDA